MSSAFNPLCHRKGHLPLDQVTQGSIQPGLEHSQGWRIHNFSAQISDGSTTGT